MNYVQLGNSGIKVSAIGLGTQNWGEQNSERDAYEQLDWAVSHGINFIDTAEIYPAPNRRETQGRSEEILGEWISRNRHRRHELVISSKIKGPGQAEWIRGANDHVSKNSIAEAIEGSLRRLQTDYIDLYQIHWPERYVPNFGEWRFDISREREAIPILQQIEAMTKAIQEGKIRAYGLSNETCFGLCEFVYLARHNGLSVPVSTQNSYNLVSRMFDGDLAEASYRLAVPLVAYGILAKGLLSSKFRNGARPSESRMVKFPRPDERYLRPRVIAAAEEYAKIADKHGVSLVGLALAFVRSRFFVTSTLIGGTSLQQLQELANYFDYAPTPELLSQIDAVHAIYPSPASQ